MPLVSNKEQENLRAIAPTDRIRDSSRIAVRHYLTRDLVTKEGRGSCRLAALSR